MFRTSLLTGFALVLVATIVAAKRQTRRALAHAHADKRKEPRA